MLKVALLLCIVASLGAAPEPNLGKLGVSIVAGYRAGDASTFRDIADPSLVAKIRKLMVQRLSSPQSFAPNGVTTPESIATLQDTAVVDAFVKFVHSVNQFAPHMTADWSFSLREVVLDGSKATVVVAEHLKAQNQKDGTKIDTTSARKVEFRMQGGRWLYIAGPATSIHLDLPLGVLE